MSQDSFVVTHGSGRPMFVLHGGPGLDHTYFRPWLDPLGARQTLIYLDALGTGRSLRDVDLGDGLETWVAQIEAVRTDRRDERVDLLGHSFGGFVALAYAIAHPERVERLVLCATGVVLDEPSRVFARVSARGTTRQIEKLAEMFGKPLADDASLAATFREILPLYLQRPPTQAVEKTFESISFSAKATAHGIIKCLPTYDLRTAAKGVRAKTLAIVGRHDWLFPPESCDALVEAIPRAKVVVLEDSVHMPFVDEPETFIRVVDEFLNDARPN